MKLKQKVAFYLTIIFLVVPFVAAIVSSPALAYKCTGQTGTTQDYYRDGACYQPVGNTCLDNPAPANAADCKNRDTSKDVKVNGETPVKNDGSAITDWTCSSGTYNATKKTCETCNSFGACQTNANVTPTPNGNDTTVDPKANNNGTSGTNSSTNKATAQNAGGSGDCGGEKTDYFACGGSKGSDAIVGVIKIVITVASIGVGIVAVGGLVYGAILYASAQDNQDQTRKAVVVIRSVIIGVLLYVFMVAIINFLVPGGVFTSDGTNNNTCSNGTTNSNTNANQNTNTSNTTNSSANNSTNNCSTSNSTSSTNSNQTSNSTNSNTNSNNSTNQTATNQTNNTTNKTNQNTNPFAPTQSTQ